MATVPDPEGFFASLPILVEYCEEYVICKLTALSHATRRRAKESPAISALSELRPYVSYRRSLFCQPFLERYYNQAYDKTEEVLNSEEQTNWDVPHAELARWYEINVHNRTEPLDNSIISQQVFDLMTDSTRERVLALTQGEFYEDEFDYGDEDMVYASRDAQVFSRALERVDPYDYETYVLQSGHYTKSAYYEKTEEDGFVRYGGDDTRADPVEVLLPPYLPPKASVLKSCALPHYTTVDDYLDMLEQWWLPNLTSYCTQLPAFKVRLVLERQMFVLGERILTRIVAQIANISNLGVVLCRVLWDVPLYDDDDNGEEGSFVYYPRDLVQKHHLETFFVLFDLLVSAGCKTRLTMSREKSQLLAKDMLVMCRRYYSEEEATRLVEHVCDNCKLDFSSALLESEEWASQAVFSSYTLC